MCVFKRVENKRRRKGQRLNRKNSYREDMTAVETEDNSKNNDTPVSIVDNVRILVHLTIYVASH